MSGMTRNAIKQSCLKMLNDRPLNQITVKAIVEDCGINRNSFYYHFADIPSLINEIVMENADRIIREHAKTDSLEECLAVAARFMHENKRAVMHIYRSANRDLYEQYLMKVCRDVIVSYAQTAYGDVPVRWEDWEILIRFYQCELFGQMILWLESDMRYDIQAQFARLCELRRGFGEEMIRRSLQSDGKIL